MRKLVFKLDKKSDKEVIKLAWPSILEQMLEMMVGMVSTIFMGRIGTTAVAAVGMDNMLVGFLQTVFSGLSIGTTVVIARLIGEGNKGEAKRALIQSMYMAIFVGVVLLIVGRTFSVQILKVFFSGSDVKVFNVGLSYFHIIVLNLPFFVLDIIVSGAMRGAGDTKTPMVITGIVNVINIFLNYTLTFGVAFIGIRGFGVEGSAVAVTISRIIAVTIRVLALYNYKGLKLKLSLKENYRLKLSLMKRIANVGVPGFIEQAVLQGGFLALEIIVVSMGTTAMAAFQVGMNINSLAFFPIFGFAIANMTLVGQSLGERDYKKAEHYAYESLKIAIIIGFGIGVLMLIFSRQLAMLYSKDPLVINESLILIRTFAVLEPLMAILNLCSATLKSAGDIMYVMVTSFVGLWVCRIFTSFVLNKWLAIGLVAVAIGIFFDFSSRSIMYLKRMNKGKWKYLKV